MSQITNSLKKQTPASADTRADLSRYSYSEVESVRAEFTCRSETNPELISQLRRFYETFDQQALDRLSDIYSEDVVFSDPIHVVNGCEDLKNYFEAMCESLSECRFEFVDVIAQNGRACLKWNMFYRHPRLKSNALLKTTGLSLIRYSDKIDFHEDFYDMGVMLYEQLPLLGFVIRKLKAAMSRVKKSVRDE